MPSWRYVGKFHESSGRDLTRAMCGVTNWHNSYLPLLFQLKSPQERRIEELEQQIKALRERTESMQHEWLRLQGHVVKLSAEHQKIVADINLLNKRETTINIL